VSRAGDEDRAAVERENAELPEGRETLWLLAASPAIWALHFVASYVTGAIWCAKVAGPGGSLGGARVAVAAYTVVALAAIAATAWRGFRKHAHGTATVPHDFDTPGDRHRFLGFSTLLLSGLSAIATLYVALTVAFLGTCR